MTLTFNCLTKVADIDIDLPAAAQNVIMYVLLLSVGGVVCCPPPMQLSSSVAYVLTYELLFGQVSDPHQSCHNASLLTERQ